MTESTIVDDTAEGCLERIKLAWNAGDAHAYAGEFAEDATYVIYLGDPFRGREEIGRNHVPVLTKWQKGTKMTIKVIDLKWLGPDAVSVLTAGGIGKGANIPFDKLQTFTLVRRGGRWSCVAFQNTKMSRSARKTFNPDSSVPLGIWRSFLGRSGT